MKKGILILTILLLIGTVYATDINNLKVPDNWEVTGDGSYREIGNSPGEGNGQNLMVQPMTDSLKKDYFINNTEEGYSMISNGNNTFNFTDDANKDYGCFEVVNIDGKNYFVLFFTMKDAKKDKNGFTTYETMMEFNKLNNLKPISVT